MVRFRQLPSTAAYVAYRTNSMVCPDIMRAHRATDTLSMAAAVAVKSDPNINVS